MLLHALKHRHTDRGRERQRQRKTETERRTDTEIEIDRHRERESWADTDFLGQPISTVLHRRPHRSYLHLPAMEPHLAWRPRKVTKTKL